MIQTNGHEARDRFADPERPPMDPPSGLRRIKLRPHEMGDARTATDDLFVLAHLGVPRVDARKWSLRIDGLVGEPTS
ncbi:hypothetical protein [Sinorhizobium chiapasense]|uniref:Uncharacterized protein n=1 Tax=Sinorhizobium chiapasense TaxID=501572 RepID=A0ABZ2BMC5_9HYPH